MKEKVIIPQSDIDALEKARLLLHKECEGCDTEVLIRLTNITEKMWKITHKKYPKAPSLDNLEVVEECKECFKGVVRLSEKAIGDCTYCKGEGKATREANWDDIDIVGIMELLQCLQKLSCYNPIGKSNKSGGILRVKGEE